MRLTCIGGPYDGRKHEWGTATQIALPKIVVIDQVSPTWPRSTLALDNEVYRLEMMDCCRENGEIIRQHFWVHSTLTRDDVAQRLFENYRGTDSPPPSLALRTLLLAADLEAKAAQLYAEFADKTDVLTLNGGAQCDDGAALYVAADLVRQARAKIQDLGI